jgi:ganglioside GM2 activator
VSLTAYKKVLGIWTKLPCIDNVGSCDYDNICTLLPDKVDAF